MCMSATTSILVSRKITVCSQFMGRAYKRTCSNSCQIIRCLSWPLMAKNLAVIMIMKSLAEETLYFYLEHAKSQVQTILGVSVFPLPSDAMFQAFNSPDREVKE